MMKTSKLIRLVPFFCLLLMTCHTVRNRPPHAGDFNIITEAEIKAALARRPMDNVLELVSYLRPKFLSPRAQPSVNQGLIQVEPVVYLNNTRYGDLDELQNIGAGQVVRIEYLKSSEATYRLGIGHEGGAILVSTR